MIRCADPSVPAATFAHLQTQSTPGVICSPCALLGDTRRFCHRETGPISAPRLAVFVDALERETRGGELVVDESSVGGTDAVANLQVTGRHCHHHHNHHSLHHHHNLSLPPPSLSCRTASL